MIGSDLYTFRELWRQYRICRRNKRNTFNALTFEINAEGNLLTLQKELRERTYRPGKSICFVTDGPKPREVFAAEFRDRVVHHLLVSRLEKVFEPRFIHDCFACRPGKGTLAASDRLMEFLGRATANGKRRAWAIKLDVASFFPSIHKRTLDNLIKAKVAHPELRWLTEVTLFHDPTTDYAFRSLALRCPSPGNPGYPIPARKSLFGSNNERGLPIGNLTSQFWANVYLDEVDQFIKRELRCRHYVRYVDDMILLADDPEKLHVWRDLITDFLAHALKLDLRDPAATAVDVKRGIDFVGWSTWWNHRLPRARTLASVKTRIQRFERTAVRPSLAGDAWRVELQRKTGRGPRTMRPAKPTIDSLYAALASYSGHLRHGAAWTSWHRLWAGYP